MVERGYRGSSNIGLLEKWNRELMDENAVLKEKLGNAKIADTKNPAGSRTLSECEAIIDNGLSAHQEAWFALKEIHDRKLYSPRYSNFKDYCLGRWGYRQEGYRYLQAAEVTQALLHNDEKSTPPPPTSAHARALAPLLDEPEKMKKAWVLALELNDGHPTFLDVRDIVEGFLPPKPSPSPTDTGETSPSPPGQDGTNEPDRTEGDNTPDEPDSSIDLPSDVAPSPFSFSDSSVGEIYGRESGRSGSSASEPVDVSGAMRSGDAAVYPNLPNNSEWTLETVRQYESHVNSYIRMTAKLAQVIPDRKVWLESVYKFVKNELGFST